jgi:hypothetical protein
MPLMLIEGEGGGAPARLTFGVAGDWGWGAEGSTMVGTSTRLRFVSVLGVGAGGGRFSLDVAGREGPNAGDWCRLRGRELPPPCHR